jgi:hypothetical protein
MSNLSSASAARTPKAKWIRVSSAHFSVLTDAGDEKGREVSLRLEQMRDIFAQLFRKTKLQLAEPLDVIALKSDEEYIRVAPLRQGQPISAPGFFLPGEDRNYIVLDLSADGSWRAVSREFARLLLSFNYPPTQDWFDEGFAAYFSSLDLHDSQAQIGGDPAQNLPWDRSLPGQSSADSKSFVELLNRQWPAMPDLFAMRQSPSGYPPMFYAQSWIVMHYLLNQNKLSEAGTYFLVLAILFEITSPTRCLRCPRATFVEFTVSSILNFKPLCLAAPLHASEVARRAFPAARCPDAASEGAPVFPVGRLPAANAG